jgi:hypothetical protein
MYNMCVFKLDFMFLQGLSKNATVLIAVSPCRVDARVPARIVTIVPLPWRARRSIQL